MTRRYPNLRKKQEERDSKIVSKIITAWDVEQDSDKVLDIFIRENKNLSDERYWETLRTVWIVCGSIYNIPKFRELFNSKRSMRFYFSTPEEAKELREMPDNIKVYRACDSEEDGGISWTTSLEYANQYKETFNRKMIATKLISKKEVFAFINRNKEYEILVL